MRLIGTSSAPGCPPASAALPRPRTRLFVLRAFAPPPSLAAAHRPLPLLIIEIESPPPVSFNFDILDDDKSPDPIEIVVYNPQEMSVYRSPFRAGEGTHRLVGRGRFKICISNGITRKGDKEDRSVGLFVRVRDLLEEKKEESKEAESKEVEKSPQIDKAHVVLNQIGDLMDRLEEVKDRQANKRERESRQRDLAESMFNGIVMWWFLEFAVLIAVVAGQILFLKRHVERNRFY